MKTIKVLLSALVISAFSFSCSSDDDGSSTGGDLTARWNPTKTIVKISGESFTQNYTSNEPGCDKDYIEFTDGGLVNNAIYFKNAEEVCTQDAATPVEYTRTDNTLVIADGEYGGTYEISKLTGSELQIKQTSTSGGITSETTVYFSKASNN